MAWRSGKPNVHKLERARQLLDRGEAADALPMLAGSAYGAGYDTYYFELFGRALLECGHAENAGRFLFLCGVRRREYVRPIEWFLTRHHDPRNFRQLQSQFPMRVRVFWHLRQFPPLVAKELRDLGWPEDTQAAIVARKHACPALPTEPKCQPADHHPDRNERVADFFQNSWPPQDAAALYRCGWDEPKLTALGKEVCVRAALAVYALKVDFREETAYDRSARRIAEKWVLHPTEENRKAAGRLASAELPRHSRARAIANLAGSRKRWAAEVGAALTGNPYHVSDEQFNAICDCIKSELLAWTHGQADPVAERYGCGD